MMRLADKLCQVADDTGIEVYYFPMPESESMSVPLGSLGFVGIDSSKPRATCEECVRLGHELGHCLYGGFYNRYAPYDLVKQHEYRADAWFIQNFISVPDLQHLIQKGCNTTEMAEALDVTEEYIKKALYYWTECRGVDFGGTYEP